MTRVNTRSLGERLPRTWPPGPSRARGFTLIELSMVVVILGLLSVVALPKLVQSTTLSLHAHGELLAAELRRVQWQATSGKLTLCVVTTATQLSVHPYASQCQLGEPVTDPLTLSAWVVSLPSALTLTDTASALPLWFNSWGQPNRAGAWRLAAASSPASVVLELAALTGFISATYNP